MYEYIKGMKFISDKINSSEFSIGDIKLRFNIPEWELSCYVPEEYEQNDNEIVVTKASKLDSKEINEEVLNSLIEDPESIYDLYRIENTVGDYFYRSMDGTVFVDDRITKREIRKLNELMRLVEWFNRDLSYVMDIFAFLQIAENADDDKVKYIVKNSKSVEFIRFAIKEIEKVYNTSKVNDILNELRFMEDNYVQ